MSQTVICANLAGSEMQNLGLVLLVFAFVCAVFAAWQEQFRGVHMGWLAITFWIAAELFGGIAKVFH